MHQPLPVTLTRLTRPMIPQVLTVPAPNATSWELYTMAGGLVAWGAHREHVVALSTVESEYMATARGAQQME